MSHLILQPILKKNNFYKDENKKGFPNKKFKVTLLKSIKIVIEKDNLL